MSVSGVGLRGEAGIRVTPLLCLMLMTNTTMTHKCRLNVNNVRAYSRPVLVVGMLFI